MINEQNRWLHLMKRIVLYSLHSTQQKTTSTDQVIISLFCASGAFKIYLYSRGDINICFLMLPSARLGGKGTQFLSHYFNHPSD